MEAHHFTSVDLFAEEVGDKNDVNYLQENSREGKMFCTGRTCIFRGKEVPCMVLTLTSGSIASKILAACLQRIDRLGNPPPN